MKNTSRPNQTEKKGARSPLQVRRLRNKHNKNCPVLKLDSAKNFTLCKCK